MPERKRILTGIRPTGPLHLGHYAGALSTWLELQREYECYFLIADYQVSDHADDLPRVRNAVWDVALDWLAAGLDPEGASFVIESGVPEHAELTTWLAWLLPLGMLERNPTLRAEMEAIGSPDDSTTKGRSVPVAFYVYPVMQVANILLPRAISCRSAKTSCRTSNWRAKRRGASTAHSGRSSRSPRRWWAGCRGSWAPTAARR